MTIQCKYCENGRRRCWRCGGHGLITDTSLYGYKDADRNVPCPECMRRGWVPCDCRTEKTLTGGRDERDEGVFPRDARADHAD